ncbi:MAG TPA: site-specific DNA-methyltransferase [Acholeplasma sp.]|nr:site-specific DNA-methyltransferase [Acholeplasma sp.]
MKTFENESIDVIFADPPYFLSSGGKSISSGKIVSVDKGEWDKKENYGDVEKFTFAWVSECYRILKKRSSIWISSTHHNLFVLKDALDKAGFKLINIIIWKKIDPPPLIYKNKFRFSYEFVIWANKGYGHYFNYNAMYNINNQEMEDVWILPAVAMSEKKFGKHPTQKPECLLERIIKASTLPEYVVLDPFMGSGTTGVVCKKLGRKFIGIEKEKKYYELAKRRIIDIE